MRKTFLLIVAMLFAISGWTQTTLNEGFEGTTFPPGDWTKVTAQGTVSWERYTDNAPRGTACASVNYQSPNHTNWLITPKLSVTSGLDTISFWVKTNNYYANTSLNVLVSTTDNATASFSSTSLLTLANTAITTTWTKYSVVLTNYVGDDIYVAFKVTDANGMRVMLDDVTGPNLFVPSCPKTSVLSYSNITSSSVDLSWTETGSATQWLIEYKPSTEASWDNALSVSANSTTMSLTDLAANTNYYVRVKAVCGANEESDWRVGSFHSECAMISSFPWFEGFENSWNTVAVSPGNKPAPYCWTVVDKGGTNGTYEYWWKQNTDLSYVHSGNGSAKCYTDYGTSNHNDWLITPQLPLTGNERLRFWAMRSSSTTSEPDEISIFISDANATLDTTGMGQYGNMPNFTQVFTQLLPIGNWQQYEINLSAYAGNRYIAFVRQNTPDGYNLRLDDVVVDNIPTCFPPTNFVVSNISTDQAELAWTPANEADASWNIYLKNLTTNSTEIIPAVSNTSYTFTNLTPNTNYYAIVTNNCSDATSSDSSVAINFRTNCIPADIPFSENFNTSVITEPTCWTRFSGLLAETSVLTSTTGGWSFNTNLDTSMTVNIYGNSCNYWLVSPTIDLGQDGTLYQLDFDAVYADVYAGTGAPTHSPDDKFAVVVSTDNGLTWSSANATIWYDNADSTYSLTNFTPTLTHISVKLQDHDLNPYQGLIKIALYAESQVAVTGADNYLLIDNFNVDLAPVCPDVFNVTASVATLTSAQVNFATDNAEEGITWEMVYGEADDAANFNPDAATPISINSATELPYNITGLNSGSTYYVAVRQSCGGAWSQYARVTLPSSEQLSTLPYTQNFNDLSNVNEWTLSCPDTNKWVINSAVNHPTSETETTGNSLYISNDNGVTNAYTNSQTAYAYASTYIDFGSNAAEYNISFDWKANGESSSYDYMRVYLLPINENIPTTGWPAGQSICGNLNIVTDWQHANIILPASLYQNTIKKLVFVWWNDGGGGTNPPAAVDNLSIQALTCATPSNLVVDTTDQTTATLSWTENGNTTQWLVEYSTDGTTWNSVVANTNTNFILTDLIPSTAYQVKVTAQCGTTDLSTTTNAISFRTACGAISNLPWNESFDTYGTASGTFIYCWARPLIYSSYPSIVTTNHSAPASIKFQSETTHPTYVITPQFNYELNTLKVSFWLKAEGIEANRSGTISLGVMNSNSDTSTFELVQTIQPTSTDWTFYEISLSGISLSGLNNYIAFKHNSQASNWYYWLDDINVDVRPTCPNTYSLGITSVTENEITLNWSTLNSAGQGWEISYGESTGFDPSTGNIISVNDDPSNPPYTINGLSPETTYSFAVRQACGGEWSNIVTSRTSPLVINSFPYSTTFDTTDNESLNWTSISNSVNKWNVGGATYSTLSPSSDGSAAYMSFNDGDSNSVTTSTTYSYFYRDFDFGTDPTTYNLTFDWKCLGSVNSSNTVTSGIMVIVCDVTDDINLTGLPINQNQRLLLLHGQTSWQNATAQTDEISGVKRLIFYTWGGYATANRYNPAAIDNINIDIATCVRPSDILVNNSSSTSADISWTGSADSYIIAYRSESETNNTYISVAGNNYSLTNLISGTDYYVSIKSICGTDTTIYSSTITFRTPCYDNAISNFPYNEGFENGLNCWTVTASGTDANSFWRILQTGSSPTCTPHEGTNMVQYNSYSSPNTSGEWTVMASPALDFSNGSDMQLSFWMYRDPGYDEDTIEGVYAYVNSTQDTVGGTLLGHTSRYRATAGWDSISYTIPSTISGTQYIVLKGYSEYGNNIYVDDVTVDFSGTPCADPTSIIVNNITNTTADVAWTAGGSETSWQVRLGTDGTPTDVNTSSYQLTNLTAATNYTVYVRANCGTSYSAWVASTQFTTTNVVVTPPTVVTDSVSAIAQNQANLYGTITTGTETISAQGFAYKLTSASTWISVAATGTNMTYNLTGLTANSSYDFRAFATTATNTYYGNILNFTTTNVTVTPPTIVTDSVSAITHNQANLYGTITAGTETISAQGFAYKLASASTWTDVSATGAAMTYNLIGLAANTAYEFKAFATTATNTYYGNVETFTTLATPVVLGEVSTQAVTNLIDHSALLHGTLISVGNAVENIEVGFVYSTETNPIIDENDAIKESVTYVNGMTTYDKSIIGLLSETNYYYKAYVTNSAGTAYGQEQPFLTSSLNDVEKNQFTVSMYPNPTTSTTKLVVSGIEGDAKIVISDVQGRILNTTIAKAVNGKVEQTIDVNNFAKGIYYVRIQNTTTSRTQKLIVQ